MNRLLLAALALLFLLPDARAQAPAIRPPARPVVPPALTPGYNPNTPPDPVHTPPGTGLPEVGQPGTHAVPVKRSPNTRALPDDFDPKKEPGIWAADGAPQASTPHRLFGVDLVFPETAKELFERKEAFICLSTMTRAARKTGTEALITRAPPFARRCMATQAFSFCLINMLEDLAQRKRTGQGYDHDEFTAIALMVAHTRALGKTNCDDLGVELNPDEHKALDALAAHMIRVMKGDEQP